MSTLQTLLQILRTHAGDWISGEDLSHELGVTRSAVWKHVSRLRRDGYAITSAPRKGYRLTQTTPLLLPEEIQSGLRTRHFGNRKIVYLETTDSTNTRARELANRGIPEGTLVVAEEQTAGRGRKGRVWHSPEKGGIYLSLILRPKISPLEAPKITLLAGIAAAESILSLADIDVHIKWPNDILIGKRKVAGVLTEIASDLDEVSHVVTGLGINANVREFPAELQDVATSLALEIGRPVDRAALVRAFLERYEHYYTIFLQGRTNTILERWKALSRTLGSRIAVEISGKRITGMARDIERDGSLILETPDGKTHRVFSGDLETV
ncbi:MAG: biotin--[acetyl-CoA-carboxylase] ligase [Desulfobacteraceae bacterium]